MAKGKRDDDGYSLGRAIGAEVARRIRERMEEQDKSQADLMRATGIPNTHISNLLNGKGGRLWQRHQLRAVSRALGVSELELFGDLFFPEIGTVISQHLPPGLAEFAMRHEDDLTMGELRRLRDEIRVVESDGQRAFDDEFWGIQLRLMREHRGKRKRSK